MNFVIPSRFGLWSVLYLLVLVCEVCNSCEVSSVEFVITPSLVCEVCFSSRFWSVKCVILASFGL